MKARLFLLPFVFLALLISPCLATVVTFDDLFDRVGGGTLITNRYQGLVWSNFAVGNAILQTAFNGLSGYYYGMITPSNVVLNGHGDPAEVDAVDTNFNFFSAYLTGAWNSNLNITVQGFRGGAKIYDQTVVVAATNPAFFAFNFLNIDRLSFNSFGGDSAGFSSSPGENFAMDNFTFEFVPEPSTLALVFVGLVGLIVFYRSRRVS
jgi:hypothetical protein